jgi:hypothetical protein
MNIKNNTASQKGHRSSRPTKRQTRRWWAILPRGGWPAYVTPSRKQTKLHFLAAVRRYDKHVGRAQVL